MNIQAEGLSMLSGELGNLGDVLWERWKRPAYLRDSDVDFSKVKSAFSVALHMHQPLVPRGGCDLRTAKIISNLQNMMENQGKGDNHNAPVFLKCYQRMSGILTDLVQEGKSPRVMMDYSGTLFYGLKRMGAGHVIDALREVTTNPATRRTIEWLGTPWGHPVAPSTPVRDYYYHVRAFQHHFVELFGLDAFDRVRGFSPSEMAIPNHPDVAYQFVRTLKECGYLWVLVQEHTVEQPEDGHHPARPHIPHRLVCTNSSGETESIVAIIKTQGSDTKLVGQMQPYYEAKGLSRVPLAGREIPPLVTQIADGENGGVMMNEFPPKYFDVMRECAGSETPAMNVTEYLEHLTHIGVREEDFPVVQPIFHKAIWERCSPGEGPDRLTAVIEELKREGGHFHMDGGSWTHNISWVNGYKNLLGPMEEASSLFHEKIPSPEAVVHEARYKNALYHLLTSQTSCYRYWGEGEWTDYGREICRRAKDILTYDF